MKTGHLSDGAVFLPFQGTEPISRHCSYQGAKASQLKAGSQSWKVFLALRDRPLTMHELEAVCDLPLATICARLGFLRSKGLVQAIGARKNPNSGVSNTTWSVT